MTAVDRIRLCLQQAGFTPSQCDWMAASCPDLETCLRWVVSRRKHGWTYGFNAPAEQRRAA